MPRMRVGRKRRGDAGTAVKCCLECGALGARGLGLCSSCSRCPACCECSSLSLFDSDLDDSELDHEGPYFWNR